MEATEVFYSRAKFRFRQTPYASFLSAWLEEDWDYRRAWPRNLMGLVPFLNYIGARNRRSIRYLELRICNDVFVSRPDVRYEDLRRDVRFVLGDAFQLLSQGHGLRLLKLDPSLMKSIDCRIFVLDNTAWGSTKLFQRDGRTCSVVLVKRTRSCHLRLRMERLLPSCGKRVQRRKSTEPRGMSDDLEAAVVASSTAIESAMRKRKTLRARKAEVEAAANAEVEELQTRIEAAGQELRSLISEGDAQARLQTCKIAVERWMLIDSAL
ncbi:MAG: hypothetical protein MMC23_007049 [Stictis urceolatum]|nr:hypothetical protein [Stictis urceolata]